MCYAHVFPCVCVCASILSHHNKYMYNHIHALVNSIYTCTPTCMYMYMHVHCTCTQQVMLVHDVYVWARVTGRLWHGYNCGMVVGLNPTQDTCAHFSYDKRYAMTKVCWTSLRTCMYIILCFLTKQSKVTTRLRKSLLRQK